MTTQKSLWEILVPTVRPNTEGKKFFTTRYHKVWDQRVRQISGGLTIMGVAKGQWVSPAGVNFVERMIPVRFIATREEADSIIDYTGDYYGQEAVLCYEVSNNVIFKSFDRVNTS